MATTRLLCNGRLTDWESTMQYTSIYSQSQVSYYSDFLVRLAWVVEVLAVSIGFTISVVMGLATYNSFEQSGGAGFVEGTAAVLVTALPFVLIAVVELCKIPLVFAFMAVKNLFWRSLFLIFVLFLCLITFETMFNGFERNFANLNRAIDERNLENADLESEKALLEMRRAQILKFTEEDLITEVTENRSAINDRFELQTAAINAQTRKELAAIDYSFEPEIMDKIEALMATRDDYYDAWSKETALVEERFSAMLLNNISGSSDERDRLLQELEILKAEFEKERADASFFTETTVENRYRSLIAAKEAQLQQITLGYLGGDALTKQAQMEDRLRNQMQFVNSKYERRLREVNDRIDSNKQAIIDRTLENETLEQTIYNRAGRERRDFIKLRDSELAAIDAYEEEKYAELAVMAEQSFGIDEKIFALNSAILRNDTEIRQLINQNQIYRLAMYAYNIDEGTDVDKHMLATVALVWFGSLSVITAVTGVMLSLAGFYLRRYVLHMRDSKSTVATSH